MATPKSVAFYTLGCKLNYSETSALARQFESRGYHIRPFEDGADIFVINTCSVTEFADRKCRYTVRQALRHNSEAKIVVTGCYAQLKPQEIVEIEGVDLVLGAAEKFRIVDFVEQLDLAPDKAMMVAGDVREADSFVSSFSIGDRTRSFLKVQDGCDYKCTFCTIPMARGASRSDTIEQAVANAKHLGSKGIAEIVLTGINLGDFGNGTDVIESKSNKKGEYFIDLIKALDDVDSVARFRISSIEPNLLTDDIIQFVAFSKRFMPHFHIPLQSGSNEILALMKRRYKKELYTESVQRIKELMPHACIGVDVIVGFPGETDSHFEETLQYLEALDISYLHVFTYSERNGTLAASMPNPVPLNVRRSRNQKLNDLSSIKRRQFYQNFVGQERLVLIEKSKNKSLLSGYTDNYIKVTLPFQESLINTIIPLELVGQEADLMVTQTPLVHTR